jgi:hypothetical protein
LKIKIKLDYKYIHTSMLTYHFKNMSILIWLDSAITISVIQLHITLILY